MRSYRIGMYDSDPDNKAVRWIEPKYPATADALDDLNEVVREFNKEVADRPDLLMCLGNFPVKPRRKAKA